MPPLTAHIRPPRIHAQRIGASYRLYDAQTGRFALYTEEGDHAGGPPLPLTRRAVRRIVARASQAAML